jgi:HSP90 family molecular chaperone
LHRRLDLQYDLKENIATAKAMSSAGFFLINIVSALDNMFMAYMKLEEYRLDVEKELTSEEAKSEQETIEKEK